MALRRGKHAINMRAWCRCMVDGILPDDTKRVVYATCQETGIEFVSNESEWRPEGDICEICCVPFGTDRDVVRTKWPWDCGSPQCPLLHDICTDCAVETLGTNQGSCPWCRSPALPEFKKMAKEPEPEPEPDARGFVVDAYVIGLFRLS